MHVCVDEPGEQSGVAKINDFGAGRARDLGANFFYQAALHQDFARRGDAPGFDVEQARGVEDDGRRGLCGLCLGCLRKKRRAREKQQRENCERAYRFHSFAAILNHSALPASKFFAGIHALEAVGFILPRYLAVAQTHDRIAFREREVRPMPPISAHGAAANVLAIFVVHQLVDVEMALQHGQDVATFKECNHIGGIRDGHGVIARRAVGLGPVREIAAQERNVCNHNDRRATLDPAEIVAKPVQLRVVNASFPEPVGRRPNRIQHDEVVSLVIERIVRARADAIFVHFLAVAGVARRNAAFAKDAKKVVITNGVVQRDFQVVFGALIQIEQHIDAGTAHSHRVKDQVAAADCKIRARRRDLRKRHGAAVRGVQFRLDVRIREEHEIERARGFGFGCGEAEPMRIGQKRDCSRSGQSFQEFSAARIHAMVPITQRHPVGELPLRIRASSVLGWPRGEPSDNLTVSCRRTARQWRTVGDARC